MATVKTNFHRFCSICFPLMIAITFWTNQAMAIEFKAQAEALSEGSIYAVSPGFEGDLLALFTQAPADYFSPFKLKDILIHLDKIIVYFSGPGGKHGEIQLVHKSLPGDHPITDQFAVISRTKDEGLLQLAQKVATILAAGDFEGIWIEREPSPTAIHEQSIFVANNPLSLLWILLFILLIIGVTFHAKPVLFLGVLLFIGSWLIRFAFGPVGPGNEVIFFNQYGLAPQALLSLFSFLGGPTVGQVVGTARILGSLAPVFLAFAIFGLRRDWLLALATGIILSIQPLLIRFSGDCERQSYVIFLGSVAIWAVTVFLKSRGSTLKTVVSFVILALSIFLCVESRPEAFTIVPIVLLLGWPGNVFRKRTVILWIYGALIAGLVIYRFPGDLSKAGNFTVSNLFDVFFDPVFTSPLTFSLVIVAGLIGTIQRNRVVVWAVASLAIVQTIALGWPAVDVLFARFHTVGFLPFAFLSATAVVSLLDKLTGKIAWLRAHKVMLATIMFVIIAVSGVKQFKSVLSPIPIDLEFQFLVENIPKLPNEAQVYYPRSDSDGDFRAFAALTRLVKRPDVRWLEWGKPGAAPNRPQFFYMHSMCNANPMPISKEALEPRLIT